MSWFCYRIFWLLHLLGQTIAFWRMGCTKLEISRTDPIVQPGQVSSHAHTYVGGSNFGINATNQTLIDSYCTSCELTADLSGYWSPLLYWQYTNGSFIDVEHSGTLMYYLGRGSNNTIVPFPPGFRMVAGDAGTRSFATAIVPGGNSMLGNRVSWLCITNPYTPQTPNFTNTDCPSGLRGQITFPTCWNGVDLWKPDQSHVAYLSGIDTGSCPPTHPYQFMQLFMEVLYSVNSIPGKANGGWLVLSNGDATGYSFHADFQNAWDQKVLQAAIAQCNSTFGSGTIESCPPLQAVHMRETGPNCPYRKSAIQEQTTGLLDKLPGCIKVTVGPSRAQPADSSCPVGTQPPPVTPTKESHAVIRKLGNIGQSFGNDGFVYRGCSNDSNLVQVLTGTSVTNITGLSIEWYQSYCSARNYKFAGVEFGQHCQCGNYLLNYPQFSNSSQFDAECYFNCPGDPTEYCGGRSKVDIYDNVKKPQLPLPTVQKAVQAGYYSKGCYVDSIDARILNATETYALGIMTPELCSTHCKGQNSAYQLFGLEFGQECFCGSTLNAFKSAPSTDCNMLCPGNNDTDIHYCGGPGRMNVYYNPKFGLS